MAKLNHIRRYRFDDETNLALQKLGKKEAQEVRQCIREMLEKKGLRLIPKESQRALTMG